MRAAIAMRDICFLAERRDRQLQRGALATAKSRPSHGHAAQRLARPQAARGRRSGREPAQESSRDRRPFRKDPERQFSGDCITGHRINENLGNIPGVMNGDLGRTIARLQQDEKSRLLAGEMATVS